MNCSLQKKLIQREADQIEADAKASLDAWIILGESRKYQDAMDRVRKLRTAATLPTKADRDAYLA